MKRLFLAIRPPDAVLDVFIDYASGQAHAWPGARWTKRENLHLTACFFGDVEEEWVPALADDLALGLSGILPFSLEFEKISLAPPGSLAPTMIWAGFRPNRAYEDLARSVRSIARKYALGMPDEKELRPHITLARFRSRERTVSGITQLAASPRPFAASGAELIESELSPTGPTYVTLETYSFRQDI